MGILLPNNRNRPSLIIDENYILDIKKMPYYGGRFKLLFDVGDWNTLKYSNKRDADLALCLMLAHVTEYNSDAIDRLYSRSKLFNDLEWNKEVGEEEDEHGSWAFKIYGETIMHKAISIAKGMDKHPKYVEMLTRPEVVGLILDDYHLGDDSDLAGARRLVNKYSQNIRYCPIFREKWLYYHDGKRWVEDSDGFVMDKANEVVNSMAKQYERYRKLMHYMGRDRDRDRIRGKINQLRSTKYIKNILEIASSDLKIKISYDKLDSNTHLINLPNGVYDLDMDKFITNHNRNDLITKLAQVEYSPSAQCPKFKKFISEIMMNDEEAVSYLQKLFGYCLNGKTNEEIFVIMYGSGANGKSVLMRVISQIFGDYAAHTPPETFLERKYDTIRNDLARLRGTRLVYALEPDSNRKLAEGQIKAITGGDPITARYLYGEYFTYKPTFTPFLITNHKPGISPNEKAIWRRIHLIPFNYMVPQDKIDKDLTDKLIKEKSGILNWLIEGHKLWKQQGLHKPGLIEEATSTYRKESDFIEAFIEDCCKLESNATAFVSDVYSAYIMWANLNAMPLISKVQFSKYLGQRGDGIKHKRFGGNYPRGYIGLKLNDAVLSELRKRLQGK